MTDRDCANCKHHTEGGCSSWDCEFEPKDLISRADAIEAVKETKPIVRSTERNWGKMIAEQHSKELVKALKALPSADAVDVAHDIPEYCSWSQTYTNMVQSAMSKASADAVQGEWVDVDNEPYCECSVCGSYIDNLDDDYAFCPRCGARMTPYKGGEDE